MHVTFETPPGRSGALIAHVRGSLDAATADQLWESASQLVDEATRFVVLDLTRLSMLTSAGIGILVRLYTRLQGYGGGLAIFGCGGKIREIFSIVMLDDVLHVCDSEAEAWQSLARTGKSPRAAP